MSKVNIDKMLKSGKLTGDEVGKLMFKDLMLEHKRYKEQFDKNNPSNTAEGLLTPAQRKALVNSLTKKEDIERYNLYCDAFESLRELSLNAYLYIAHAELTLWRLLYEATQLHDAEEIASLKHYNIEDVGEIHKLYLAETFQKEERRKTIQKLKKDLISELKECFIFQETVSLLAEYLEIPEVVITLPEFNLELFDTGIYLIYSAVEYVRLFRFRKYEVKEVDKLMKSLEELFYLENLTSKDKGKDTIESLKPTESAKAKARQLFSLEVFAYDPDKIYNALREK